MYGTVMRTMKCKANSESQLKLLKVMALIGAVYRSKTWTTRKNHKNRMQRAEMKFLLEWPDMRVENTNRVKRSGKILKSF
jgi:hypothetical protein